MHISTLTDNNYYSFGMLMPNRHQSAPSYRYGFNGMEKDDELKGNGNSYDFGGRNIYDGRIGRFISVDPFTNKFPFQSPYIFANNNPILHVDQDGGYAITIHYLITAQQLRKYGITDAKQVDLLAHYASVFADHPGGKALAINNIVFPFNMMFYRRDEIDYSLTENSQRTDLIENSIWHAMKSDKEEADNSISDYLSQLRGMEFGWGKIFESAKEGKLDDFDIYIYTKGLAAFGQGIHALQDSEAHKGVGYARHQLFNDAKSDPRAHTLTGSAILVHQIMSGATLDVEGSQVYTRGMSEINMNEFRNKLSSMGYTLDFTAKTFGSDDDFYTFTISKKKN